MYRARASFTTAMELYNGLELVLLRPCTRYGDGEKCGTHPDPRRAAPGGYVTVTVASRACFLFALALR